MLKFRAKPFARDYMWMWHTKMKTIPWFTVRVIRIIIVTLFCKHFVGWFYQFRNNQQIMRLNFRVEFDFNLLMNNISASSRGILCSREWFFWFVERHATIECTQHIPFSMVFGRVTLDSPWNVIYIKLRVNERTFSALFLYILHIIKDELLYSMVSDGPRLWILNMQCTRNWSSRNVYRVSTLIFIHKWHVIITCLYYNTILISNERHESAIGVWCQWLTIGHIALHEHWAWSI